MFSFVSSTISFIINGFAVLKKRQRIGLLFIIIIFCFMSKLNSVKMTDLIGSRLKRQQKDDDEAK